MKKVKRIVLGTGDHWFAKSSLAECPVGYNLIGVVSPKKIGMLRGAYKPFKAKHIIPSGKCRLVLEILE